MEPWRGPGAGRPDLPLPPGKVPIRRGGSWRKQWRYLGAFSDELMLCAARVQVGPVGQTFWAVWDREERRAARAHAGQCPGPRPRRGLDRARRGRPHRPDRLGPRAAAAPWSGSRRRAPLRRASTCARSCAPARASGSRRLPDRRGRQLRLDSQARRSASTATSASASAGSAARRAGSRTSRAATTPTTRSGTGRPGSGDTADGRDVAWNLVNGINDPPQRSERAIWVDGEPQRARAGELRRPRGDRGRRRAAGVHRRGRAQQERGQAVGEVQLPPAVRHLQRHASRRARAGRGLRRHGAPRRPLVGAEPADGLKPLPPIAKSTRRRAGGDFTGRPRSTRQRHGGCSPGANSYWLRPSSVSRATSAGIASSGSGVGASSADLAPRSPSAAQLPAERRPVEPVCDRHRALACAVRRRPRRTRSRAGSRR